MLQQSSMYFYFNWVKECIDEMDVVLVLFEFKVGEVRVELKVKMDQFFFELKQCCDVFQVMFKIQVDVGEVIWVVVKVDMEK